MEEAAKQDRHPAYTVIDSGSIAITITAMADIIPPLVALLALIWWAIRIYETKTVQGLIKKWKARKDKAAK